MSDVLVIMQRDESPVAEEIAWDIDICSNTFVELSEAWARLRKVVVQLNDPEKGYVLPLVGAQADYARGLANLEDAVKGLSAFLAIQEAYLSRIKTPQIVPTDHASLEAVSTRANGAGPIVDDLPVTQRVAQRPTQASATDTWVNKVSYGPSLNRSASLASRQFPQWLTKIVYSPQLEPVSFEAREREPETKL